MKYISRIMEKDILEASKNYSVIMVCGQRQVGKSTMLNHIKEYKTEHPFIFLLDSIFYKNVIFR